MQLHFEIINKIIRKHFSELPKDVKRAKIGLCNEVYFVKLKNKTVVVRLNKDNDEMKGSEKYIPLFRSKGIKVPHILVSDYSKKFVPYYYQVQSKLEGDDINRVISILTAKQLKAIAKEIAKIFKKLLPIPTNGKYGFVYAKEKKLKPSLTTDILSSINTSIKRGTASGVLDKDLVKTLKEVFKNYKPYFDKAPSKFYYDDMSSKNVMIYKGKFNGLVDLDGVCYGDCLETVGRIMASWHGTTYGTVYSNALMHALKLNKKQREIVTVYAFLNRVSWMCENGVQFNANTKGVVDWGQARKDKKIVDNILKEIV